VIGILPLKKAQKFAQAQAGSMTNFGSAVSGLRTEGFVVFWSFSA
jgi:hypothetical protein